MLLSELVDKIKKLRFEKGLTLEGLAQRSGLSKGYLSKIENKLSIPTVSTLQKLATAFDVDFTHFFSGDEPAGENNDLVFIRKDQREKTVTELPEMEKGISAGSSAGGTMKRWALAAQKKGRNMDPYIIELSHDNEEIYQHQGEGFIYILEGRIQFGYGGESYTFEEGDTLYLDCNIPYSAKSISQDPAQLLMVIFHYKRVDMDNVSQLVLRNK